MPKFLKRAILLADEHGKIGRQAGMAGMAGMAGK